MHIELLSVYFMVHALFWVLGFIVLFRIPFCHGSVPRSPPRTPVSIIIPARNEEGVLPNLLRSLQGQLMPQDEVIVVNDHSEDGTGAVAERSGVKVLASLPAPAGWLGKSWACYQGARAASGEVLVFLDADTTLDRDGLQRIVDAYLARGGVLSVQPYHRTVRPYEELSAFFNLVMMAATGAFTVLGDRIKPMGLFGPAVVMSRQDYVNSGGHEIVKGEVLEDVALGSALRKKGLAVHCLAGRGTVSFRMYPHGLRDLINGWSKGFALGAARTPPLLLVMIVVWIAGGIAAAGGTVDALAAGQNTEAALWGGMYALYAAQVYWMLRRIGNFRVWTALLYPVPLFFFIAVFAYSYVRIFVSRSVRWKGRRIDLRYRADR